MTALHFFDEVAEMGENSRLVDSAIKVFKDGMTEKLVDEMAVVYVIGAFSAGKSRLIRELLRSYGVTHLLPISSQDRQSALPVEITYGEEACLVQVDSRDDRRVALSAFPSRQEQQRFDASEHHLRLEVPEPALLLGEMELISEGDGGKRLVLKDMPGWNSGDSFIAEDPLKHGLVDGNNLSLVYVVRANGVDSQDDLSRLEAIFTAVEEGDAYFHNGFNLVVVVTRCEDKSEYDSIGERLDRRFQAIAEKIELDEGERFKLTVLCVDFGKESESLNQARFIEQFWSAILLPVQEQRSINRGPSWERRVRRWPEEWLLQKKLSVSLALLSGAKKAVEGFKHNDHFIEHMNGTRLLGLSDKQRRDKVFHAWRKQAGEWTNSSRELSQLRLHGDHPLALWWNEHYWLKNLSDVLGSVDVLFSEMEKSIKQLPKTTDDLSGYFDRRIELTYSQAKKSLRNSFYSVGAALDTMKDDDDQAKTVATLLSLSMMDAKYSDYLTLFEAA